MAEIRPYPLLRHLRADAVDYILHYRRARLVRGGPGLSLWFNPMTDSVAEVPTDDREVSLMLHARSSDFQDVAVNGVLTYRPENPERLAQRVDFTIDPHGGDWKHTPLDNVATMLSQLAQEHVMAFVGATPIRTLLAAGVGPIRDAIENGFRATPILADMGLTLVGVRVGAVAPAPDLEKAMEAPMRERIKQEADEAAYSRRALAVEKERAIAENEMQNKIELSRREEQLLAQQGQNAKRQAEDAAQASKIEADSQAERIEIVDGAHASLERQRLEALATVSPATLLAMAAREFADKVQSIEHLNVTPDLLGMLTEAFGAKDSS